MSSIFFQKDLYPRKWTETNQEVLLVEILKGETEYNDVKERFDETMQGYKIDKIERVQNKTIWRNYSRSLEEFKNKYKIINESIVESTLFHGTRTNDPSLIYNGSIGLDIKYSNNGSYGYGLYFAMHASYSANGYSYTLPNGQRQFFLCRVILGNSVDQSQNLGDGQDSIKGSDGSMFILKENHRSYPDYLITFSKKNFNPQTGRRGRVPKSTVSNNNSNINNNQIQSNQDNTQSSEDKELELALALSMSEQDDYDLALAIQLSAQDYNNNSEIKNSNNINNNNGNENEISKTTTSTTTTSNTPPNNNNNNNNINNNTNSSNIKNIINLKDSKEYDDYELALALELSKADGKINSYKRNTCEDPFELEENEPKKKR